MIVEYDVCRGSNLWRVAVNDQTLEFPTFFALLSDRRVGYELIIFFFQKEKIVI